jgi:hypothetical protein
MIFNKTSYYVPSKTKNNTNIKDHSNILNNFTIIVDFKSEELIENESTIISKEGTPMGLFLEKPNIVKFVWYTKENKHNEVSFNVIDITEKMNIKVIISDFIELYRDNVLMVKKEKGDIINYIDNKLMIGALNPFSGENERWFNGEINEILVYDTIVDYTDKNVYIKLNFEENSKFKTFDNSGNGNHGVLIEDPKYVNKSIDMFNNVAPKQKII